MKVLLRVDASLELGAGHVVRCLSLADGLRVRGAHCTFACAELPESLADWILAHGHGLERLAGGACRSMEEDAGAVRAAFASHRFDWLVVDHYRLGRTWEQRVRHVAAKTLVIDDLANRPHDCEVLLDQNLLPDAGRYSQLVPQACRVLLGPRFALLRPEFSEWRQRVGSRPRPLERILISFGGTDARDFTSTALRAVQKLRAPAPRIDVVIGAEHPRRGELEQQCEQGSFELHVQTTRMAELMAEADLAIGAGGSTTWERCCLGLPALVAAVADNQVAVLRGAAQAGVLFALDAHEMDERQLTARIQALGASPHRLAEMSIAGMALVDGRGVSRVLRAMGVFGVQMRAATSQDARDLFEWRNLPAVRAASHSPLPLDWAAHLQWLDIALKDPAKVLLIGEAQGLPAGVVRFDIDGTVARISIYTVPERAGGVSGADVLGAAEEWMLRHRPEIRQFTAEVLPENLPSHRLFQGAGFERNASTYFKRAG